MRTRKVDTHEENGGTACSGLSSEQQSCSTGTCPAGNIYIPLHSIFDRDKYVYTYSLMYMSIFKNYLT